MDTNPLALLKLSLLWILGELLFFLLVRRAETFHHGNDGFLVVRVRHFTAFNHRAAL